LYLNEVLSEIHTVNSLKQEITFVFCVVYTELEDFPTTKLIQQLQNIVYMGNFIAE